METNLSFDEALSDGARRLAPALAELRHELHQYPEVGLDLPLTQAAVLRALEGLGLEIQRGTDLSSVTAVLRGGAPGPAVLLRADMDALPVTEETVLDFASLIPGVMHACGHDLHTTMLAGAARLLTGHRAELAGDVVFMFQPGEEGDDGAAKMIAEGVLDASGQRVSSAYGMHVQANTFPMGVFSTRPGTLMAAADSLHVTIRGSGGHGSTPHLSRDPISVAAELVGNLQTLVTRRFNVFDPIVISVGAFHAGTAENIIPGHATFDATVRTFSTAARDRIRSESVQLCEQVAAGFGLAAEAVYTDGYPVTVNDADRAHFAADVASEVFGNNRYQPLAFPRAGGEDFSRVLAEVPGCYLMLGACPEPDYLHAPSNHSPHAQFSDNVLADGALLLAQLAVRSLLRDATRAD